MVKRVVIIVAVLTGLHIPLVGSLSPSVHAQNSSRLVIPNDAVLPVLEEQQASIEDWYIVTLRDDAGDPGAVAQEFAQAYGIVLSHVYREVFPGFAAKIPAASLSALQSDSRVVSIQPDEVVRLIAKSSHPEFVELRLPRGRKMPSPKSTVSTNALMSTWRFWIPELMQLTPTSTTPAGSTA